MNVNEQESHGSVGSEPANRPAAGSLAAIARTGAVVLAVSVVAWMVWRAQGQASPAERGAAGSQRSDPQEPVAQEPPAPEPGNQKLATQEPAAEGVRSEEARPLTPEQQLLLSSSKSIVIDLDPPPVVLPSSKFMPLPKTVPSRLIKQLNEVLQEHAKTEKAAEKKGEGKKGS